jgi:hypothetical protein
MIGMMQAVDGTFFDEKSGWLKTNEGDLIASLRIQPDGKLGIGLGMDTNFQFQDGRVHYGWKCEEHIASGVILENESGTLDYQKGRCLFQEGISIKIAIIIAEAEKQGFVVIALPLPLPQGGNFFQRAFSFLR